MSVYADPSCKLCGGAGRQLHFPADSPPYSIDCSCTKVRKRLAELEMGWAGVSMAPTFKKSPLAALVSSNAWVTATDTLLRGHLKSVFLDLPKRSFRVVTDSDLMTAWLATAASEEIFDLDARGESSKAATLPDLVVPPDLLVVRLGVKTARNSAMGEVLGEALTIRLHRLLPVWVVDSATQPYSPGHLAFASSVSELLAGFERANLERTTAAGAAPPVRALERTDAPPPLPAPSGPVETGEEPVATKPVGRQAAMLMKMIEDDGKKKPRRVG